jgi:ParB-like chromosome segregation protein Spo0J
MLFAPAIADTTEKLPRNEPLVRLIACAFHWQELLESGRFTSIRELAKAVGKNHSYIARLLRLTLLAPDIIEAILNGQEPNGLSQCKLFALPLEWEKQREALGMAILQ